MSSKVRQAVVLGAMLAILPVQVLFAQAKAPTSISESTADHSKFEELQGVFTSGPEVTRACLGCHTEGDDQLMHTLHWNWSFEQEDTGQQLGKRYVLNSFCGNVASNEARCTSCHTGYGWTDMRQPPPTDPTAVDCLVCHDRSGQYTKLATDAGHPPLAPVSEKAMTITGQQAWAVDLALSAQSVGEPSRENCGNCHFYGGGGDNVKHGDLSSALLAPAFAVDVHMSAEGRNFSCVTCHTSEKHNIDGSRYDMHVGEQGKSRRQVASCQSCHGQTPHGNSLIGMKLNDHISTLACQTCHIPAFARGGVATKTLWDWSTGGKLKDGKAYSETAFVQSDGQRLQTYASIKGDFDWGENVTPHYAWFDGQVSYTDADSKIDPSQVVEINQLSGEPSNPKARIWPFKRMVGRQAYDSELNELVYTNVYGPGNGTAFWSYYDWGKSIAYAMDYMQQPYSGKFDFVDTAMYWPITHMVAPADDALGCETCHAKDGRLNDLPGVYVPASVIQPSTKLGLLVLLGTLFGIVIHALLRLITRKKGGSHA